MYKQMDYLKRLKNEIKVLESEEKELWHKQGLINAVRDKILVRIFYEETGIELGDDVLLENGTKGIVIGFDTIYGKASPRIRLYNKNGDLGKRRVRLYNKKDEGITRYK